MSTEDTKPKINHHKPLSDRQIKAINEIKTLEYNICARMEDIYTKYRYEGDSDALPVFPVDDHWKWMGRTRVYEAFMYLIRSIAMPDEIKF